MTELVVTPGSLGGIGYEIAYRRLQLPVGQRLSLFGDTAEWNKTQSVLGGTFANSTEFEFIDRPTPASECAFGGALPRDSLALRHLVSAIKYVSEKPRERALINCAMKKSDFPQPTGDGTTVWGHTEILLKFFRTPHCTMCFASDEITMITLTRHISLRRAVELFDRTSIVTALEDIKKHIRLFGNSLEDVRIGLLGLNPHAGENGMIGNEEIQWMGPLVAEYQQLGWNIQGPLSADTILTPPQRRRFDIILSCYHDQLLPAFKALYFHRSAQFTLGLPIIRTSVDHGVAEDLYLKGTADLGGFETALSRAATFIRKSKIHG